MIFQGQINEKILLLRIAEGDDKAFEKIYGVYQPLISKVVLKFVKSPDLTEDLTQEIFIRIWDNRTKLVHVDSFYSYLVATARNHVLNFLKKTSKETAAMGEILRHYKLSEETAEERMISEEYRQHVNNILDFLSPQVRKVFRLCVEDEKSYDEVTSILGISRNTVKKHMVTAHKKMKNIAGKANGLLHGMIILLFSDFL
jgi:RNA polymerase sigma-70 factor (family 1)